MSLICRMVPYHCHPDRTLSHVLAHFLRSLLKMFSKPFSHRNRTTDTALLHYMRHHLHRLTPISNIKILEPPPRVGKPLCWALRTLPTPLPSHTSYHDCGPSKSNVHNKISGSLGPKGRLQIKVWRRFCYKECKLGQKASNSRWSLQRKAWASCTAIHGFKTRRQSFTRITWQTFKNTPHPCSHPHQASLFPHLDSHILCTFCWWSWFFFLSTVGIQHYVSFRCTTVRQHLYTWQCDHPTKSSLSPCSDHILDYISLQFFHPPPHTLFNFVLHRNSSMFQK